MSGFASSMPWTGVKTNDDDNPLVAPEDIWIIFRLFCDTFACFSFFCVARRLPPSLPNKPKSKPMLSSPYSPPSVWAKARLFICARISVGLVFSLAFLTLRPPRFFLPVIISGGGRALTFWAFGGSQAFSIFDSMSSLNDCAASTPLLRSPNASNLAHNAALLATNLRHRFRRAGGACWTKSQKYKTPVWGIPATIPNPPRYLFSCPMTVMLQAGTRARSLKPPAMPTNNAAKEGPTKCVKFGASIDMRDCRYCKIVPLSSSNFKQASHPLKHSPNSESVKG
mmetsp:Transcript_13469/g.35827  ORF Transcript_13469/g.35827 Transcript_13469/m.35827 type:complete len:282 (-) Transcript_13469:770-1615(-)